MRTHASSNSKQLLQHVLKNIFKIDQDERVSFSKWMEYHCFYHIHELRHDLQSELKHIHDYIDYINIVNGQHCTLKVSPMNKLKLLISLMATMGLGNAFQLSFQYILSLTYNYFNKFWQEDMIRMTKVPTTQTPSTTKPFLSLTSRNKTRPDFLSQLVDIFDEPNCDSTKAILLEKDEHDPSPSPNVKSATNLLGTKRAFTRVHSTFPEDSKKIITEECKDVK